LEEGGGSHEWSIIRGRREVHEEFTGLGGGGTYARSNSFFEIIPNEVILRKCVLKFPPSFLPFVHIYIYI
jgi:hypothetical protein